MKLEIPILYKDQVITDYELGRLKNGVIADSAEAVERSGEFGGMLELVSGCIKEFRDDSGATIDGDPSVILRSATIQMVEILALKLLTAGKDVSVDQVSICPRCKDRVIYEDDEAIRFEDLEILTHEGPQEILIILEEPIRIKDKRSDQPMLTIESVTFQYPTIADGLFASSLVSDIQQVRRQFAIYSSSIIKINGEEAEKKFTKTWGLYVLDRMLSSDLEKLSSEMKSFGIQKTKRRVCRKCGKKWDDPIDMSDFFESGLR